MGRFFQTAPTQFVEDYIYQPPWELMQQAASQKQKIYDAAIASTKLFDNIPIEHLQGEDDVYNVQEKQRYYAENAANIAKAIQNDPSKAQQYLNNIDSLQKELQKDMTSGDLSKIIGSAQAYKKWQEDNKKRKEDDPSRYSAAERTYLADYLNAGGNSLSQGFRGEQVTKDVDWEKVNKVATDLKASSYSKSGTTANGMYLYTNKETGKQVTEEEMNAAVYGQIMQNPSYMAALRQSQQYGLAKYFNDTTGALDFNASGWRGTQLLNKAAAWKEQSNENDIKENSVAVNFYNQDQANRRQQAGFAQEDKWKNIEREDKLNENKQKDMWETTKIAYDPNVSPELRQAAQARLSAYYGLGETVNVKNKNYSSIGEVLQNLDNPTNKTLALNYFKQKATDAMKNNNQGDYFMYRNLEAEIKKGNIKDMNSFTTIANSLGKQGTDLGYTMHKDSEENPVWGSVKTIIGGLVTAGKTFLGGGDGPALDRTVAFADAKNYVKNRENKTTDNFTGFIINDSKKSFEKGGNYNNRNVNLSVEYIAPEKSINLLNNFNNPMFRNNFTFFEEGSGEPLTEKEVGSIEKFSKYGVAGASHKGDNTNVLVSQEGKKYIAVANNQSISSNSLQQVANYSNYKNLPVNSPIRNNIYNSTTNFFQTQALNVASKNPGEVEIFLPNPYTSDDIKFNKQTGTATIIDSYGNSETLPDISTLSNTILNRK